MAREVIMPMLGMAQDSGKLTAWLKSPGDAVTAGEVLFEVETDKSVSEVEATCDGFLTNVQAAQGTDVPVGQVIAMITDSPDEISAFPQSSAPEVAIAPVFESEAHVAPEPTIQPVTGDRILASPKARRMAEDAGLDLSILVEDGLPQPFHAAEIAEAIARSGARQSPSMMLQIGAQVPGNACDTFLQRMRAEAGVELSHGNLVLAFAARALRHAIGAETLTLSLETVDGARLAFVNPDQMRLSAMTAEESNTRADLTLLDLRDGYLTVVSVDPSDGTILVMTRTGGTLHLTLTYRPDHLTTDQSILMMRDLTERLAEPMLALV